MKKLILIIIIFLISEICYSQDTTICFSIPEAQKIAMKINRCDYLELEVSNLNSKDSLNNIQKLLFQTKINNLDVIIKLQDDQLNALEKIPKTVVKQSNYSFWEISGIIVGSVAVGVVTGYVLKK